ncbi:hypothetical protein CABS03_05506 [Colletotrichum abscissum]|uniref:Uncharacterized protein n=2 Tax=Colletotrichum acutatum species complex TaxID=2707335 RepID=A0A9P9X592_9PEZI|nr:hypothetical protein CABS02_12148 [Colletotrichum abscissum]KAK0369710.1 hypothetical protein CLIM01_12935 [Colletotrichum limetticola]
MLPPIWRYSLCNLVACDSSEKSKAPQSNSRTTRGQVLGAWRPARQQ